MKVNYSPMFPSKQSHWYIHQDSASCKATSLQKEIKKRARFKASKIGGKKRQTNLDFPYKDLSKREERSQGPQAQGTTN